MAVALLEINKILLKYWHNYSEWNLLHQILTRQLNYCFLIFLNVNVKSSSHFFVQINEILFRLEKNKILLAHLNNYIQDKAIICKYVKIVFKLKLYFISVIQNLVDSSKTYMF